MITMKEVTGLVAGGICAATPVGQVPVLGEFAQAMATKSAENLVAYFQNPAHYIQKTAAKIMSHESEEDLKFVVSNAKSCFEMIDAENLVTEIHHDSWTLSQEKTESYLKTQQGLSEKQEWLLKKYLPALLESPLHELQTYLVKDPEFLIKVIRKLYERSADGNNQDKVDESRSSIPPVAEISAELKNEWIKYPFLERKRKNKKKELREFYKLPFGKLGEEDDPNIDIHMLLQKTIDSGNDRHNRMLVLMGAPGSGKTTVITYLLNNLKIDRPVRVYPLSGFVNMNPSDWPGDILTKVGKVQEDLSNSVLILDGLDELDLHGRYDQFVEKLQIAWANNPDITNFTLILTCRTTRLDPDTLGCNYVILAPLSEQQISDFASDYLGECPLKLKDCLEGNKGLCNVLGIPILLYMVLGLGLTVDSGTTIAGLYDEIFSTEGKNSIYKRGYNKKEHPVTAELAEKIHLFSQDVAVEMFYREEVQAELEKDSYISLAQKTIGNNSTYKPEDLLIGQYFLQGQEGQEIYFVHRSIFEYFVALAIFNELVKLVKTDKTSEQLYKEMAPGKSCSLTPLATLLSLHHLSDFPEIKDFLHHLIQANPGELSSFSDWAELAKLIFEYGLADAVPDHPHGGDQGLREEAHRFLNLLDICRCILRKTTSLPIDLVPDHYHRNHPSAYWGLLDRIVLPDLSELNLSGTYLCGAFLAGADFSGADLSGAILSRAFLSGIDLSRADLSGADLSMAELSSATLPDDRSYVNALKQDGKDVMLQFTDPERWNKLYPDKAVDPDRFRRKKKDKS